jgi:hypothetical protein
MDGDGYRGKDTRPHTSIEYKVYMKIHKIFNTFKFKS